MTCPPHHWVLSSPEHGEIKGRCKRCRARRAFTQPAPYSWSDGYGVASIRDEERRRQRAAAIRAEDNAWDAR